MDGIEEAMGGREEIGWGDMLGGDFVLSVPNPFLKSGQTVMCMVSHG